MTHFVSATRYLAVFATTAALERIRIKLDLQSDGANKAFASMRP